MIHAMMRFRANGAILLATLLTCGCQPSAAPPTGDPTAGASPGGQGTVQGTASTAADKRWRIAVVPKGTLHEFWRSIHAGAIKAARELGNVEIIWKGPGREDDREQQCQVVESLVNSGIDALVLAPLDRAALVGPVRGAVENNKIPVLIIDSALDYDGITSYVATDNVNGGRLAARRLAEVLQEKGNVVVLRYQIGSASTEQREEGFLDEIKKFPNIKVLSDETHTGATREGAQAKAENMITRFGDQINGWFCPCEPVTYGVLQALRARGLVKKMKIVGFDSGEEMVPALAAGEVDGLVLQDPVRMGYLGVMKAAAKLRGEAVDAVIATGETVATPANRTEAPIAALLAPDLKPYLNE